MRLTSLLLIIFTLILYSFSALAEELKIYSNINANPKGAIKYQVVATISILWEKAQVKPQESAQVEEDIVKSLKSLNAFEIVKPDSIDMLKKRILGTLNEPPLMLSNKVIDIFITDLYVKYTGPYQSQVIEK